jgi:hypothetical protein
MFYCAFIVNDGVKEAIMYDTSRYGAAHNEKKESDGEISSRRSGAVKRTA